MSDENKMGVKIIEFHFHKIDKIKVAGADSPRVLGAKIFSKE